MRKYWKSVAAVLGSILLCILLAPLLMAYTDSFSDEVAVLSDWEVFLNEEGRTVPLENEGEGIYSGLEYAGQTFYFSTELKRELESPVMKLALANQCVSVFLGDKLLYTDCPEADNRVGYLKFEKALPERASSVLVSLPRDYLGEKLTVAQQSFEEIAGSPGLAFPCEVTLYGGNSYSAGEISAVLKSMIPAAFLAAVSALVLALFLYTALRGQADFGLLSLSLFGWCWMGECVFSYGFAYQYFPQLFFIPAESLCQQAGVLFMLLFLLTRSKHTWRILLPTVVLYAVSALLENLAFVGALPVWGMYSPFDILPEVIQPLSVLTAIGLAVWESRKGSVFFRAFCILTVAGMGLFLASCGFSLLWRPGYLDFVREGFTAIGTGSFVFPLLLLRILLIFSCCLAALYEFVSGEVRRAGELQALSQKNEMAMESYKNLRRQSEYVMAFRHDMKNHLNMAEALLENGEPEKAREYLREVTRQSRQLRTEVHTGNDMADIILNSKITAAVDTGIRVEISRAELPGKIPLNDVELCSLLTNVLDNAVQAASGPGLSDPYLLLDLHEKNQFVFFCCENSNSGKASPSGGEGIKKKEAVREHGYGLKIIKNITEKYHGILEIQTTEDIFKLSVAIPLLHSDK